MEEDKLEIAVDALRTISLLIHESDDWLNGTMLNIESVVDDALRAIEIEE